MHRASESWQQQSEQRKPASSPGFPAGGCYPRGCCAQSGPESRFVDSRVNLQEFRRILNLTLLLPLVLLLPVALGFAWQIERTLGEQKRIDQSEQITSQLNEVHRLLADEASSLHAYEASPDPRTLAPYQTAAAPFEDALNTLQTLIRNDPEQQGRLRQLRDSHALWLGLAGQLQAKLKTGQATKDGTLSLKENQAVLRLHGQVRSMREIEGARRRRLMRSTSAQIRLLMLALLGSCVGLGVFLGIFTYRNLKRVSNAFRSSLEKEHQRADELREGRQWLQTILDSVGDALIASDRQGRIRLMNPIAQDLTGWKLSEAKGRPIEEIFRAKKDDSRAPAENIVSRASESSLEAARPNQSVLLRKDGRETLIESKAAPIYGAAGVTGGSVLVFRDVTDQKRAEAALLANEKLAVAGRLAASIAHEIHNPLDAVANLHYLLERESGPEQQRRYLAMAKQELARTLQISRSMLSLYREPIAPVALNLRELLESVLVLCSHRLKEQEIAVEQSLDESAIVEGFPGELRQVFTNLITNAAEAAGAGGRMRVRLQAASAGDCRFGAVVTITDSGTGVPPGLESKLFQPFFTTKGEHGTGLGLWVSRGIVEKHGGTLEITNAADLELRGAAVRVSLPGCLGRLSKPIEKATDREGVRLTEPESA